MTAAIPYCDHSEPANYCRICPAVAKTREEERQAAAASQAGRDVLSQGEPPQPEQEAGERALRLERLRRLMHTRSQLDEIPPPGWMIDGILGQGSLAALSGKFGTYKTFVAVAWACSVATGVPWLGRKVHHPGPVLYIAAEGASGVSARIRAWEAAHFDGDKIPDDRLVVVRGVMKLNLPGDVWAVTEVAKELRPALIIWDTLHRSAPGAEENSSRDMGYVVDALGSIREDTGATQLVCHHTGHAGKRSRGSSSIEDDFDDSWVIELGGDGEDRSPRNPRTMVHRKVKEAELSANIGIKLLADGYGARLVERTGLDAAAEGQFLIEQRVNQILDAAGLPQGVGERRARAALKEASARATTEGKPPVAIGTPTLREILRLRHATRHPAQLSADLGGPL